MHIKEIVDENFQDYNKASMFIGMGHCDWKCCHEANIPISVCQNSLWGIKPEIWINDDKIVERYLGNPITSAIVFGGLEPLMQEQELFDFMRYFRGYSDDDLCVYTGYYPIEIRNFVEKIREERLVNVIIKFGRYIPNHQPHFDEVLGVKLASDNQYGMRIG